MVLGFFHKVSALMKTMVILLVRYIYILFQNANQPSFVSNCTSNPFNAFAIPLHYLKCHCHLASQLLIPVFSTKKIILSLLLQLLLIQTCTPNILSTRNFNSSLHPNFLNLKTLF